MTCFDCKVCFGSKFTSSAEGRRFNWLIYDSMTSLFACGRLSKSRGLSASVSFLPSFPFPFPLFYSLHSSPCNSLLPNCTETLATQARINVKKWKKKCASRNGLKLRSANTARSMRCNTAVQDRGRRLNQSQFRSMAEVSFLPSANTRKRASASREEINRRI